jgi:hypothetical protein
VAAGLSPAAPRRGRRRRSVLLGVVAAALVAGGCAGGTSPSATGVTPLLPAPTQAGPTPMGSPSAEVAGTASLLTARLSSAGFGFQLFTRAARPSEPAEFADVPRAIYQAGLADPDGGIVVIYAFPSASQAVTGASRMAAYVGSPFGQTNYPTDAQFSVAQVNATVVFTWWAASRSSDPQQAERAFDAIASVGQPVPVTK